MKDNKDITTGKVYLVGAGPGDPGLITVKAVQCLRDAEVVIYDRLLSMDILKYIQPGAKLIFAGKSPEKHTLKQSEINQILGEYAQKGKKVVRLKGGDSFVLGRGGEEAEHLTSLGIRFEVVPGITSAVAAPAYAGIPVTHRGLASSFAVITGHEDPEKEFTSINWSNLATGVDTLVFLMAMAHIEQIVSKLITNGLSSDTPVAIIKEGTRPEQKVATGTLENIVKIVKENNMGPPAIVVVGQVVKMRDKLKWFDSQPLFSKRILVTRSRQQASQLSLLLASRGAIPVEQPAICIKATNNTHSLDEAIKNIETYHWITFTSVNGVDIFFNRLGELRLDSRIFKGLTIGAIGPATAEALNNYGLNADYVPPEYTGSSFIKHLGNYDIDGKHFLLPRARAADSEIPEGIASLGGIVCDIPIYDTLPDMSGLENIKLLLKTGAIQAATFASSSTVSNIVSALGDEAPELLSGVDIACIGPKTANTARDSGLNISVVARKSTIPGLVEALEDYYEKGGC